MTAEALLFDNLRLSAGISDATIVIESGSKGGSIITANLAWDYNRDVFAIPGRSIDTKSEGCNRLIKENKATLLDDPTQFIDTMGWNVDIGKKKRTEQNQLFINFKEEERRILDYLTITEIAGIDELNFRTGLSSSDIASALLNLEMQGVLKALPGKRYALNQ